MKSARRAFAEAAEVLVGTPFRLRGRDPASGIDCIGLVHAALVAIGRQPPALPTYTLRNCDVAPLLALLPEAGFKATRARLRPGDVVMVRTGPAQFHLAVAAVRGGFVHTHAGLGHTVLTPAPLPWPIVGRWRLT
ncbi:NlpC/P60 family protein [Aurantiacibacter luteus]|uniref:NlpC/P60 domain-containing protein n=1 Tax=Aurantiacibacter luteus TaxID=1581420 RepID=A0A0G9MUP6_9SPHN|nr:NlpC/P60 family protein [Aurantiacibacter luteus]KLE34457.1 hypothetical protein AAW00_09555 [Aurantiacibacter luteus]